MSLLGLSTSRTSSLHSASQHSLRSTILNADLPPSPLSPGSFSSDSSSSASSSNVSLDQNDKEDITITAKFSALSVRNGGHRSHEDLQLLAISTHITELSYSISDIQTRIFEIQELRHKSQSSGELANATSVIDQSLMTLDARLESVAKGVKSVNDSLEPYLQDAKNATLKAHGEDSSESAALLRKHTAFIAEWESVQEESDVLREELKEDKWLTVFRTVTDQADGMMTSLEKAVNRCQEFIWQVHKHGPDESLLQSSSMQSSGSVRSEKSPLSYDVYQSLLGSFEAKKKHYMPATTKVLSIIDKGVQDRVTKNGECLRRHAESTQRWKNLRERISRTDTEMENVRKILVGEETALSESGSTTSGPTSKSRTRNGFLTPPGGSGSGGKKSRTLSTASTLSRSISPLRKFARKFTSSSKTTAPPVTPVPHKAPSRAPSSEPVATLRHRQSLFAMRGSQPPTPVTPERPGHKYAQSMTPETSPAPKRADPNSTVKGRGLGKQPWNSSTRIEPEERLPRSRRPSTASVYGRSDLPALPINSSPYQRSASRSSMASSRPWSPVTSSVSTAPSSSTHLPFHRPPSRTHQSGSASVFVRPPSRSHTPTFALSTNTSATPRPRPNTPSHIPAPSSAKGGHWRSQSEAGWRDGDDDENPTTIMQRAFSPTFSISGGISPLPARSETPGGTRLPGPRPPSRSMIPAPIFQFSSPSRPASAMSDYPSEAPTVESNSSSFRSAAMRAQTPEAMLRARVQQIPFYQSPLHSPGSGSISGSGYNIKTIRPHSKLPPSSFRDGSSTRSPSRSGSRAGAATPSMEGNPNHYTPASAKDPLDVEVARIVNSVAHGLLIERVDPPLRAVPKEGEEIRAQYAFSNALARKIVTCRLTTMTRKGEVAKKKVMVRVGGGWRDLQMYMLDRQAGL